MLSPDFLKWFLFNECCDFQVIDPSQQLNISIRAKVKSTGDILFILRF